MDLAAAHLVYGQTQYSSYVATQGKGRLHGTLHEHGPIRLRDCHSYVGLHVGMFQERHLIGSLQDDISLIETLFHIPLAQLVIGEQVSPFVDFGSVFLHCVAWVENGRQGLILHRYQGKSLLGDSFCFSSHQGDTIAHKAHLVTAYHGLVRDNGPESVAPGHVLRGEHGYHAFQILRFCRVNGLDESVRIRAAQDLSVQKALMGIVSPKLELAGHLQGIVRPGQRLPRHCQLGFSEPYQW